MYTVIQFNDARKLYNNKEIAGISQFYLFSNERLQTQKYLKQNKTAKNSCHENTVITVNISIVTTTS